MGGHTVESCRLRREQERVAAQRAREQKLEERKTQERLLHERKLQMESSGTCVQTSRDDDVMTDVSTTASGDPMATTRSVKVVDPSALQLTDAEEREARKIEKKLREIANLEASREGGTKLDKLQLRKLESKDELERNNAIRKVRLGYRRALLNTQGM